MPICEICGLEVVKVFLCSRCDAKFCEECGDVKKKLCYDCLSWEEEDEDEESEEEDEEWAPPWNPPPSCSFKPLIFTYL
ncbi:MAG: hypothetical protein ACETVR_03075 [Candidatus Bathyarchaeia archaeon]